MAAIDLSPPSAKLRIPEFLIVGHPKCGTTALYEMLKAHPEVYMPEHKEPQYFATEMRAAGPRAFTGLPRTLEEYLVLFADAEPGQLTGEASPSYLRSRSAPGLIAEVRPDARSIAILREPASFLHSLHLQFVRALIEPEYDPRRAMQLEDSRRRGGVASRATPWPQALLYSEHVQYVDQLRRYHGAFPSEQILVLIYDDFRRDNDGTVRQVQRFLGIDDSLPIEAVKANPSVSIRARRLHRMSRSIHLAQGPTAKTAKSAVNALVPRRPRQALFRPIRRRFRRHVLLAEPDQPDETLMLELRRRFKHEVVSLSEYLGRDLVTLWGYDELD